MSAAELDSNFTLPYTDSLWLGIGVHITRAKAAYQSPFVPSSLSLRSLSKVASSTSFKFESVREQKDLQRNIDVAIKAEGSYAATPISGSAGYLSELQINDKTMCTLITADFQPGPQLLTRKPVFTKEAQSLLATSPAEFTRTYGDYYVTGYTCRSTLTAVAKHKSTSKTDLDKFALEVNLNMPPPSKRDNAALEQDDGAEEADDDEETPQEASKDGEEKPIALAKKNSANAATSVLKKDKSTASAILKKASPIPSVSVGTTITNKTKGLDVTTVVSLFATGVIGVSGQATSLEEALSIFGDFADNISPVPVIVHLAHYKTIDMRAQSPGENALVGRGIAVTATMRRIYELWNTILGSSFPEVSETKSILNNISVAMSDLQLDPLAEGYSKTLAELDGRVRDLEGEVQRMILRRAFVKRVRDAEGDDVHWGRNQGEQVKDGDHDGRDQYGFTPDTVHLSKESQFIARELQPEDDTFVRSASALSQNGVIAPQRRNGFRWVGYTVFDNWADGSNGSFTVDKANGDEIKVKCSSKVWRGCNWGVRGYKVPTSLYRFD